MLTIKPLFAKKTKHTGIPDQGQQINQHQNSNHCSVLMSSLNILPQPTETQPMKTADLKNYSEVCFAQQNQIPPFETTDIRIKQSGSDAFNEREELNFSMQNVPSNQTLPNIDGILNKSPLATAHDNHVQENTNQTSRKENAATESPLENSGSYYNDLRFDVTECMPFLNDGMNKFEL